MNVCAESNRIVDPEVRFVKELLSIYRKDLKNMKEMLRKYKNVDESKIV